MNRSAFSADEIIYAYIMRHQAFDNDNAEYANVMYLFTPHQTTVSFDIPKKFDSYIRNIMAADDLAAIYLRNNFSFDDIVNGLQ